MTTACHTPDVVLAGPHPDALLGLQVRLEDVANVVHTATHWPAARASCIRRRPDLLIADPAMVGSPWTTIPLLIEDTTARVLLWCEDESSWLVDHALAAGACGLLEQSRADAADAVVQIAAVGEYWGPTWEQRRLEVASGDALLPQLDEGEILVLYAIKEGLTYTEMAEFFGVAKTVVHERAARLRDLVGAANNSNLVDRAGRLRYLLPKNGDPDR